VRRLVPAIGAVVALALAGYVSVTESMPEFGLYDGVWMLAGAGLATGIAGVLAWRWPRERSLPLVVAAAAIGAWAPIIWLAHRGSVAMLARLRGTWYMMGGDVVSAAVPVGVACLWIALRPPDRVDPHPS
jgi:hypothetical protein